MGTFYLEEELFDLCEGYFGSKYRCDCLDWDFYKGLGYTLFMEDWLWMELLEYARWTASPHNVQPWKVKLVSEKRAELYYVPERLLPVEDDTSCFNTVGLGMFIEHLSIAAAVHGLEVREELVGKKLDHSLIEPVLFAKLSLEKRSDEEVYDRELIKRRRTSRLPYDERSVEESVLRKLKLIARSYGYDFRFSSDPVMVDWVLRLNRDTMFYDMNDDPARREIDQWLRYSIDEAKNKRDGLWVTCLRFPGWLIWLFFRQRWLFNLPGLHRLGKKLYYTSTRGTKTVGWLYGPFKNPNDWVRAGHMLAQLWLEMTKAGVCLHPFGSIITNKQSHARLGEKLAMEEGEKEIWLLMRLGYSGEPPRSWRLPVEDILL